jgi:pantoate--beta-alanine ligase
MKCPVADFHALRRELAAARQERKTVGLVPTMGALHAGHASLIRVARAETGLVVVSLFVNPRQFGPNEDFTRYPRPLDQDLELCRREGVDLVFAPSAEAIYPPDYCTYVEVTRVQDGLCGRTRPGHLRGVATVVLKLFNLVQPDIAYFGQKDAQQARLIQQLVRDLNVPVQLRICPTVREPDGLAVSSRNQYLDANQRRHATVLFRALTEAQELVQRGERDPRVLERAMRDRIRGTPGAVLDYAEVVDAEMLRPLERLRGDVLLAMAVKFGTTRLIDNIMLRNIS